LNSNLETYNPEDATFWDQAGRHIANRNLLVSSVCLALAFVVWFYWSILVLYLNDVGFDLTTSQILTLMGVPMITGATLRIVYSFVVPIFGGRNWTVLSTASLLVPTIGIRGWGSPHPSGCACRTMFLVVGGTRVAEGLSSSF
jgi:NNP family nitrate/nitrite transporter-like MFS transporter